MGIFQSQTEVKFFLNDRKYFDHDAIFRHTKMSQKKNITKNI